MSLKAVSKSCYWALCPGTQYTERTQNALRVTDTALGRTVASVVTLHPLPWRKSTRASSPDTLIHWYLSVSGDSHFICYGFRTIKPTQVLQLLMGPISKTSEFFFSLLLHSFLQKCLFQSLLRTSIFGGEMAHQLSIHYSPFRGLVFSP